MIATALWVHLEDDYDDETDDVALMIRRIVCRCTMCATSPGARVASRRSYGFPLNSRFLQYLPLPLHSVQCTHIDDLFKWSLQESQSLVDIATHPLLAATSSVDRLTDAKSLQDSLMIMALVGHLGVDLLNFGFTLLGHFQQSQRQRKSRKWKTSSRNPETSWWSHSSWGGR